MAQMGSRLRDATFRSGVKTLKFELVRSLAADDAEARLLESGQCTSRMTIPLRNALFAALESQQAIVLDTAHLLALSRKPFVSMTKTEALLIVLDTAVRHGKLVAEAETRELAALRDATRIPEWTPAIEREMKQLAETATQAPSVLTESQALVLLCDSLWREAAGFKPHFAGAPIAWLEASRDFKLLKEPTFAPVPCDVSKLGRATLDDVLLQHADGSVRIGAQRLTCDSIRLHRAVAVPSHPIVLELQANGIDVWFASGSKLLKRQTLELDTHGADYIDAVVTPNGSVCVTVAHRNAVTGGLEDPQTMLLRVSDMVLETAEPEESDMDAQDALDAERAACRALDFRDHTSVLGIRVGPSESVVCMGEKTLFSVPDVLVAALGAPSDMILVFANGTLQHRVDGFVRSSRDTGAGISGAVLATGTFLDE